MVLVELAALAAAIQGRVEGWVRVNSAADRGMLASADEAAEALGETGDAIAGAATAVSRAWSALMRSRCADV